MSASVDNSGMPNPRKFLIIGVASLLACLVGFFIPGQERVAAFSYLIGIIFTSSIAVGMLFMVMIHHIFDAQWSVIVRRQAENYLSVMPWLGVMFLPLFLITYLWDQGAVWLWMNEDAPLGHGHGTVGEDVLYLKKTWWLSETFFWIRAILCFGVWAFFARAFRKHSFSQDEDGSPEHTKACRKLAAAGLFSVAFTWSAAAFDWIMALEYHWFSTMFGVWFFANAMRAALAVMLLTCAFLVAKGPLKGIFNTKHLHDVATLCFAFTVFWAYISFSQYFLIWNGNIPEETFWFNFREEGAWWYVSMVLVFGHFLFPFLFMLQWPLKTSYKAMTFMASWILLMQLLDLFFNILPSLKDHGHVFQMFYNPVHFIWYITGVVGGLGVLLWAYWSSFRQRKIIPIRAPRIGECRHP
ncbi:MAG: hypothetical protein AAGB46_15480 [Verrucomicrobiota bacterium]